MTTQSLTVEQIEARQRAHAELASYRERLRAEREAKSKADETTEDEIARTIQARRDEEARAAERQKEYKRFWAEREATLAANREAERKAKIEANPQFAIAETPARRMALRLRSILGDEFGAFVADFRQVNHRQLGIELDLIPSHERTEALNRERAAQAAERAEAALVIPEPQDATEVEILLSNGVITASAAASMLRRQAELDAGAL